MMEHDAIIVKSGAMTGNDSLRLLLLIIFFILLHIVSMKMAMTEFNEYLQTSVEGEKKINKINK